MVVGTSKLRATHENYPRWISERYLQLPDTVPERVIDLAKQLTTAADNPYDKALILENYLRKIPYNLDISAPPAYKDVADYFIYDLGEGYCDYYATAMAVMGRAVGLPTRFVMGYATGLYDHSQDRFVITAKDAHSWVEVYFNEIGWVEFEPTGGISAIIRPESVVFDQMIEDRISSTDPLPPVENWPSWLPWLPLILGGTVLLASLYLIWRLSDTWRLRRMPSDLTATELYRRLFIQAKQLKIAQTPNQTPHEFNQNLNDHISSISTYRRWQLHWRSQSSAIRAETQQLVDLYAQTVYSPETPDSYSTYKAICIWTNLRQRLMLTRILRRLHPIDIDQNNPANKQTSQ